MTWLGSFFVFFQTQIMCILLHKRSSFSCNNFLIQTLSQHREDDTLARHTDVCATNRTGRTAVHLSANYIAERHTPTRTQTAQAAAGRAERREREGSGPHGRATAGGAGRRKHRDGGAAQGRHRGPTGNPHRQRTPGKRRIIG